MNLLYLKINNISKKIILIIPVILTFSNLIKTDSLEKSMLVYNKKNEIVFLDPNPKSKNSIIKSIKIRSFETGSIVYLKNSSNIVCSADDKIKILDPYKSGDICINTFDPESSFIYKIAASPINSNIIAVSAGSPKVKIFDLSRKEKLIKELEEKVIRERYILNNIVSFSFNYFKEGIIATGSTNGEICIFDIYGKETPIRKISTGFSAILYVKFSPINENIIVSLKNDGSINFFDLSKQKNECIKTLTNNSGRISCIALHPNKNIVIAGSANGSLYIFDPSKKNGKELIKKIKAHSNEILAIEFSYDGSYFATASKNDNKIKIWSLQNILSSNLFKNNLLKTIKVENTSYPSIAFIPTQKETNKIEFQKKLFEETKKRRIDLNPGFKMTGPDVDIKFKE